MSDFPEITTEQIVARLRMIVAEPESLCKTDFHYIEDAADEIELLRSTVTDCRIEIERLTAERDEMQGELRKAETESSMLRVECGVIAAERDEARRLLKAVVDMMRDNIAPDATHPKHVCDFIYCPEIATCMVCENWTDALVMCYPDDFQDKEEGK